MVKAALKRITAWSYSRFRDYKKCPQLAKFKFIDKLPEPEGPALVRGKAVHDTLQAYVEGRVTTLPQELLRHKMELKQLRKKYKKGNIHCEQQWAFDVNWKRVDWFSPECWLRVKMDLAEDSGKIVQGIDYKTGKFRPGEYNDQMLQYCAAMLLIFPKAEARRLLPLVPIQQEKGRTMQSRVDYLDQAERERSDGYYVNALHCLIKFCRTLLPKEPVGTITGCKLEAYVSEPIVSMCIFQDKPIVATTGGVYHLNQATGKFEPILFQEKTDE